MLRPSGAWANRPPSSVSLTLATSPRAWRRAAARRRRFSGSRSRVAPPGQPCCAGRRMPRAGLRAGRRAPAPRGGRSAASSSAPSASPRMRASARSASASPRPRATVRSRVGLRRGPQPVRLGTRSGEQTPRAAARGPVTASGRDRSWGHHHGERGVEGGAVLRQYLRGGRRQDDHTRRGMSSLPGHADLGGAVRRSQADPGQGEPRDQRLGADGDDPRGGSPGSRLADQDDRDDQAVDRDALGQPDDHHRAAEQLGPLAHGGQRRGPRCRPPRSRRRSRSRPPRSRRPIRADPLAAAGAAAAGSDAGRRWLGRHGQRAGARVLP